MIADFSDDLDKFLDRLHNVLVTLDGVSEP